MASETSPLYQSILAFEESYAAAKKWVASERQSLIGRAQKGSLDDLEKAVASFTEEASNRLLQPGRDLMATQAFRDATFDQQMGFTRWKTSVAASDGYAAISLVERAILLQKNKRAGIIEAPTALRMNPDRVEGSIGMVAQKLSDGDLEGAIDAYGNSQSSIIKHAQIETIIASELEGSHRTEAMRIVGDKDTCDYCKGLAGYWTTQLWTLRHFHSSCTCKLVTRPI